MKAKSILLALLALFTLPTVNGCYTQMARPDREEKEPEYSESTESASEEQYSREDDIRHETYVYGHDYYDYYYGYRGWGADPWWYRYPRTGLYVGIGYGFYDPYWYDPFWGPSWCGGGWDPWWGPYGYSPWSRPGYIYYPVYDPYPSGHDGYTPEKRPFGRRTSERERRGTGSDQGAIARRGSLSRPDESIYVRGEDGGYRRERRRITQPEPAPPANGTTDERVSDRRRIAREEPAPQIGTPVSTPNLGGATVAKPAPTPDVNKEPARRIPAGHIEPVRRTRDGTDDGASQRRARPVEKVSRPAREDGSSKRDSNSTDGNSSSRRGYSGSGNSGSSKAPSGGSSSSGGNSSSKGSSSGSSSSGSSRRSKN